MQKEWQEQHSMDKILNRKLFRQKYLNTVKPKNLPKFKNGGGVDGNLGRTDMSDFGIKNLPEEKSTRTGNETFMGFGGEGSAVSADQARLNILLPIAAQLMTGTVRPGQSRLSGLLESAGKGLSAVGPTILAMKDLDLKKRKEDREAAKTGSLGEKDVYDIARGVNRQATAKERQANPTNFISKVDDKRSFSVTSPVTIGEKVYKPGINYQLNTSKQVYDFGVDAKYQSLRDVMIAPEGDITQMIQASEAKAEITAFRGAQKPIDERARGVLELNNMVAQGLELIDKGAFSGTSGQISRAVGSFRGFLQPFFRPTSTREGDFGEQSGQMQDFIDGKTKLYDSSRGMKVGINDIFSADVSNLSAEQRTVITELAYSLAKAREEGGRFSVSDIELAMQAIGDYSSQDMQRKALIRIGNIMNERAYTAGSLVYSQYNKELPEMYQTINIYKNLFRDAAGSNLKDDELVQSYQPIIKKYLKDSYGDAKTSNIVEIPGVD